MNKNICITVIFILIIFKIQAQNIFEKKGMWGVSFGAVYYYPTVKNLSTGFHYSYIYDDNNQDKTAAPYPNFSVTEYSLKSDVSGFIGFSREIKLYNNDNKFFIYTTPNLEVGKIKYKYSYNTYWIDDMHGNMASLNNAGDVNLKYLSLSLITKNIFLLDDKKGFSYSIRGKYFLTQGRSGCHYLRPIFIKPFQIDFKCATRFELSFNLGLIFIMKNELVLSPTIEYRIYSSINNKKFIDLCCSSYNLNYVYNNLNVGLSLNF